MKKPKPLRTSEEARLILKAQQGSKMAKKRLLLTYNRQIIDMAFRYVSRRSQIVRVLEKANLAFLQALEVYKPANNLRFWPYAARHITKALAKKG